MFVAINCAALTESLLETELFGHERGAFTGAIQAKVGLLQAASGGTLLLDEVGEMAPALQAKLLRAIETQTVMPVGGVRPVAIDVRFLAATHRNLLAQVESRDFRRDLYYRLAGFALEIPPLRERKHQIAKLASHLLGAASKTPPPLTAAATAKLLAHDWPGNVRELRNVLERALVIGRGKEDRRRPAPLRHPGRAGHGATEPRRRARPHPRRARGLRRQPDPRREPARHLAHDAGAEDPAAQHPAAAQGALDARTRSAPRSRSACDCA